MTDAEMWNELLKIEQALGDVLVDRFLEPQSTPYQSPHTHLFDSPYYGEMRVCEEDIRLNKVLVELYGRLKTLQVDVLVNGSPGVRTKYDEIVTGLLAGFGIEP